MRFRELLEYKRDITATNYGNKLLARGLEDQSFIRLLHTEFPTKIDANYQEIEGWFDNWVDENKDKILDFTLNVIESKDPSPNKQYTQWIVMRYLDKTVKRFEDILTTVETLLRKYHELKVHRALPAELADIGKFKTATDFSNLWTSVNSHYEELEKKLDIQKKEAMPKGNAKVVFDNQEVRVIVPEDQQAACYYGQGTAWCTASTSSTNYFDYYNKEGPLYILIPKKPEHDGEKYQLHFESNQYMDESDRPIRITYIFGSRFQSQSTFDFFDKKAGLSNYIAFANDQVFEDIVQSIKEQVSNFVHEEISEWEVQGEYYYDWLRDEGYMDDDGDIKSDAPSYLDYNDEARQLYRDVLDEVDISKDDVADWDEQWGDEEVYILEELPTVVASILREQERHNESVRGQIADQIEKHLTLTIHNSKDPKMPAGWVLEYEYQVMKDGRSQWKKYKVAEKNYGNTAKKLRDKAYSTTKSTLRDV